MNRIFSNPSFRGARALLLALAVLAGAPVARADGDDEDAYMGESPLRYAQVKVVEGEVQIRKGDTQEALERGTPVAEGDVVESHGRGILQLGDGSRIAFGSGTRFEVAGLFMDRDADRQVLIRLEYGRLRVVHGSDSEAELRIDTPSGSGSLQNRCNASFEVTSDRITRLRVHTGRLVYSNEEGRVTVRAGDRLTVYSQHDQLDRVRSTSTFEGDDFDTWCERRLSVKHGDAYGRVPQEIRYYADDLDGHGEWVYVDDYSSWCWRPVGLVADWRPYWRGRWGCYSGGMTWISDEPWGYVTHHYGRWGWRASFGWHWIPGVYFSPAWVAWHSTDAYFGWAPMGYRNEPCVWGHRGWDGGYCWNVVNLGHLNHRRIHDRIHHDPGLIRRFAPGPGAPTWPGSPERRPLTPPWRRGPLLVNQREFRNPVLIRPLIENREVNRQRFVDYERQAQATGRTIYRREIQVPVRPPAPGASPASRPAPLPDRTHFEDRGRLRPVERRPEAILPRRDATEPRHPDQPRPHTQTPDHRPDGTPARPVERREAPQERREVPQERPTSIQPPPRELRERPRNEDRPAPRPEPRPEPRQETPRQDNPDRRAPERPREDRGMERRPERPIPPPPPPAARPAERPSAPRSEPSRSRELERRR